MAWEAGNVLPGSGRLSLGSISSWFTKCVLASVSSPGTVPGVWDTKMSGRTKRLRPKGFLTAREGRLTTEATVWCGEDHASSHRWAAAKIEGNGQVPFFSAKREEHHMSSKRPPSPRLQQSTAWALDHRLFPESVAKPQRNSSAADANSTGHVLTISV